MLLVACEGGEQPAAPDERVCVAAQAVSVVDRSLLGEASAYPADGALRGRDAELAASPAMRREVAWDVVERVLAEVPFATDLPNAPDATIPRFRTWYGKDDIARLFHHLYGAIGPSRRGALDPFEDAELDLALVWNPTAVEEDAAWPEDRIAEYLASLDTDEEIAGTGGISRVAYSPGAVRHLLHSYPQIVGCDGASPPPAFSDVPSSGPRRVARLTPSLRACERASFGPYFVGEGETLVARVEGEARVMVADEGGTALCESEPGGECEVAGPRPLHITVIAEDAGGDIAVDIEYAEADPPWTSCLDGPFPVDAAIVKADFRRVWPDDPLAVFDTSVAAIAARQSGRAAWDPPDGHAEPGSDSIYTVTTPAGATYRLAGLHIMTKELDHWLWITLFWSPTAGGALATGRPASIAGVFANYEMCVVTGFNEASGASTWCSNPYLELGDGNAATNCIGCHQHGGTGLTAESVLADFPKYGVTALRNNFPADYTWSLDRGDALLRVFADEVSWWNGH